MTKTQPSITLTIALALALPACGSEDGVGFAVRASTAAPSGPSDLLQLTDDGDTTFTLTAGRLHLRDIEFDLPDGVHCEDIAEGLVGATCEAEDSGNSSGDKIRVAGPFDIDLITGIATPSLADVSLPALAYSRIDFRVDDDPNDVSFAVTANFEHGGEALALSLSLDFNEDIRIEHPGGVAVDADTDLIASFVVDNWLGGVDVGACLESGDINREGDTVIIDESSTSGACSDIEDTIKSNMKTSGQLDRN